eukprot:4688749-Prorocentrum_lima.AAC.1
MHSGCKATGCMKNLSGQQQQRNAPLQLNEGRQQRCPHGTCKLPPSPQHRHAHRGVDEVT